MRQKQGVERISGKNSESRLLRDLGAAIRAHRNAKGLSQEALADACGIDRSHMGKIERGERNVTILNVERIAQALDDLPSKLIGDSGH